MIGDWCGRSYERSFSSFLLVLMNTTTLAVSAFAYMIAPSEVLILTALRFFIIKKGVSNRRLKRGQTKLFGPFNIYI
jgi:hypothetical protein